MRFTHMQQNTSFVEFSCLTASRLQGQSFHWPQDHLLGKLLRRAPAMAQPRQSSSCASQRYPNSKGPEECPKSFSNFMTIFTWESLTMSWDFSLVLPQQKSEVFFSKSRTWKIAVSRSFSMGIYSIIICTSMRLPGTSPRKQCPLSPHHPPAWRLLRSRS